MMARISLYHKSHAESKTLAVIIDLVTKLSLLLLDSTELPLTRQGKQTSTTLQWDYGM